MEILLDWWGKQKNDKYSNNLHRQWEHFSLFVLYVDGMLGKEAIFLLTNLSKLTAAKIGEPPLYVQVWVNGQISIVVAISYYCMICGAHIPSPL